MKYVADSLRQNPELAVFLTLALGFLVGRLKVRDVQARQRRRDAPRGRRRRPDRRQGRSRRQARLLRPLPLRDGLQGRAAVLPGPQEERAHAGLAHARPVRHEPRDDGRGREGLQVRVRDGGGPHGRGVHGVDRHRDGGRDDQPPSDLRRREEAPPRPDPRGVRRQLSRRDGLRRVVPLGPRAEAPEGEPQGGGEEARGDALGRRRSARRASSPRTASGTSGRTSCRQAPAGKTVGEFETSFAPDRVFVKRIRREEKEIS